MTPSVPGAGERGCSGAELFEHLPPPTPRAPGRAAGALQALSRGALIGARASAAGGRRGGGDPGSPLGAAAAAPALRCTAVPVQSLHASALPPRNLLRPGSPAPRSGAARGRPGERRCGWRRGDRPRRGPGHLRGPRSASASTPARKVEGPVRRHRGGAAGGTRRRESAHRWERERRRRWERMAVRLSGKRRLRSEGCTGAKMLA